MGRCSAPAGHEHLIHTIHHGFPAQQHGRRNADRGTLQRRVRREGGGHLIPEPRRHRQPRLLSGGGRPAGDEPHTIQHILPRKKDVLPGKRRPLLQLRHTPDKTFLLPQDRTRSGGQTDPDHRWSPALREHQQEDAYRTPQHANPRQRRLPSPELHRRNLQHTRAGKIPGERILPEPTGVLRR